MSLLSGHLLKPCETAEGNQAHIFSSCVLGGPARAAIPLQGLCWRHLSGSAGSFLNHLLRSRRLSASSSADPQSTC